MSNTFRVDGVNEILAQLEQKGLDVVKVKKDAMKQGAEFMQEKFKERAPHDDYFTKNNLKYGTLKDNIRVGYNPVRDWYTVSTGDAFWGYFLEIGTRPVNEDRLEQLTQGTGKRKGKKKKTKKQLNKIHEKKGIPAQPWFEPTWNDHKKQAQDIIINRLKKEL